MTVYVCFDKDIECGDRPENWCATCPKRKFISVHSMDPQRQRELAGSAMLAAAPAAPSLPESAPSNSGVQESVYLTSASGGGVLLSALPEACEIEAVIACLGDDAAQLSDENPDDERVANMVEAAVLLQKLAEQNAAVARLLLAQDREGAKAWARGLHISMDHDGGLTAYVSEASAGEAPSNKTEPESSSAPKGAL